MSLQSIKYLSFDITYRCRNRCIFCDVIKVKRVLAASRSPLPFRELEFSEIKKILGQARQLRPHYVIFSGGEPFLRKDIFQIIDHCAEIRLPLVINTRHTFTKKDIPKLKNPYLRRLWVSIDSHDKRLAERLAGRRDFFDEYIKGVRLLAENGIPTSAISVMSKLNIGRVRELLAFLYDLGIQSIDLRPLSLSTLLAQDYPRPHIRKLEKLLLDEDDMECLKEEERKWNRRRRGSKGFVLVDEKADRKGDQPRCSIQQGTLLIRPDGKVLYCALAQDLVIGDLRKQSLRSFLNSKQYKKLVNPARGDFKGTECFKCKAFDRCNKVGRCYKNNYRETGEFLVPDRKLCQRFLKQHEKEELSSAL